MTVGFILLRAERPLQSSFSQLSALRLEHTTSRPLKTESASGGSAFPHRGISLWCPLARRAPSSSLRSVLGVPPALDGLLHHMHCGFVSPHNHVQGFPFRELITSQSSTGFPRPMPSCRSCHHACQSEDDSSTTTRSSRALLPTMSVTRPDEWFRSTRTPRPSWDYLSSRLWVPSHQRAFTHRPPTVLSSKSPSRMTHGVSPAQNLINLEPDRSTCTRFSA